MSTAQEQAREHLEYYAGYHTRGDGIIRSLLASLESVTRDAEEMAEEIVTGHNQEFDREYPPNRYISCTCPACTTARKYRREEG